MQAALMQYILALDQATSSTRAIVFGPDAAPLVTAQQEFRQIYPHPGWIEMTRATCGKRR